jgi:hypothetical protein
MAKPPSAQERWTARALAKHVGSSTSRASNPYREAVYDAGVSSPRAKVSSARAKKVAKKK